MDMFLGLPRKLATLPNKLRSGISRLQVDVGSTGLFDGREFRYFRDFTIPTGSSVWIKVVVGGDGIILRTQNISLVQGYIKFRAWRDVSLTGVTFNQPGTPAGAASDPSLLISGFFQQNGLPSAPDYSFITDITQSGNVVTSGSASGGTCSESEFIKAPNATAQQELVGFGTDDERGVSPGTYHLQISSIGTGDAVGRYKLKGEERTGAG